MRTEQASPTRAASDAAAAPAVAGGGQLSGWVLLLLAGLTLGWGSSWPAMKIVLAEMSPWTFRTVCLLVGGLGLLAIARLVGQSVAIPRGQLFPLLLVALLNVTGWQLLSAYGVSLMSSGRAAIIAYTMPVWASLLGAFVLAERLTAARVAALALGMGGLALLLVPATAQVGEIPLGAIFMLGAAVSWAAGTVAIKGFGWRMPVLVLAGWQLLLGGVPVVLGTPLLEGLALPRLSAAAAVALVYVLLVPILFCHYAWFKIVSLVPAGVAAISTLMIPVVGVLSGALVLGEPVGWPEVGALALVLSALALTLVGPARLRGLLRRIGGRVA